MDKKEECAVEIVENPQCLDCGGIDEPGHLCHERLMAEVERIRSAFQISLGTLYNIRNEFLTCMPGDERRKMVWAYRQVRNALEQVEELLNG